MTRKTPGPSASGHTLWPGLPDGLSFLHSIECPLRCTYIFKNISFYAKNAGDKKNTVKKSKQEKALPQKQEAEQQGLKVDKVDNKKIQTSESATS